MFLFLHTLIFNFLYMIPYNIFWSRVIFFWTDPVYGFDTYYTGVLGSNDCMMWYYRNLWLNYKLWHSHTVWCVVWGLPPFPFPFFPPPFPLPPPFHSPLPLPLPPPSPSPCHVCHGRSAPCHDRSTPVSRVWRMTSVFYCLSTWWMSKVPIRWCVG